jgi:hypothetical protein
MDAAAGWCLNRRLASGMTESSFVEEVVQIVIRGLAAGNVVEIDGLGSFLPDGAHGFRFEPRQLPQVFVAYTKEDVATIRPLCDALAAVGFDPWLDERKLVPGQNWPRAIESAIETSNFFLACYSEKSVTRKGGFQAEIRYALDCARQIPLDEIFIVPVRLTACRVPRSIQRELQYVDLFPDWLEGLTRLVATLRHETARQAAMRR